MLLVDNIKTLIGTDTFHKEGSPHLMVTVIECDNINDREDKYKDVVGFYNYISGEDSINDETIKVMDDWTDILKKNIIFLLKNDKKLSGWLFEYSEEISYREIEVFTLNDINYDIWLDPETNFWNPVDFLLEAEYYTPNIDEEFNDNIDERLQHIENSIIQLDTKISELTDNIKEIVEKII